MYNIYSIVILILFDIPRFSVNDLHQIQVVAPSPSSRKSICNVCSLVQTEKVMNVNGNTHVGRQHDIVARADLYTNYFMRTGKIYLICPKVLYLPVAYLVKKGCVECRQMA